MAYCHIDMPSHQVMMWYFPLHYIQILMITLKLQAMLFPHQTNSVQLRVHHMDIMYLSSYLCNHLLHVLIHHHPMWRYLSAYPAHILHQELSDGFALPVLISYPYRLLHTPQLMYVYMINFHIGLLRS